MHIVFLRLTSSHLNLSAVQKNFVQVVRAVELSLGIPVSGMPALSSSSSSRNVTSSLAALSSTQGLFNAEVRQVLFEMTPVLVKVALQLAMNLNFDQGGLRSSLSRRKAIVTKCVVDLLRCLECTALNGKAVLWI